MPLKNVEILAFLSVDFRITARSSFFKSNVHKTKNAWFQGNQRAKRKVSTFFNGILVTNVEPGELETQHAVASVPV
jgi:hypothetical protein